MTSGLTDEQRAELERIAAGNGQPPAPATTWARIDLAALVAGGELGEPPAMLARDDGVRLLYRGKLHALSGEPEAGKGWLALHAIAERLNAGERALYLDFEDAPATIVHRLLALRVPADAVLDRLDYRRPDEPLGQHGPAELHAAIAARPTLAVIDGVNEALAIHGLDLRDNTDVAKWLTLLPRPLAAAGAAVVLIDHVVKDREARGRYAIGAQHKLAGVDVAYALDVVEPFGRGRDGLARLTVHKDRPGYLRQHSAGKRVADVALSSSDDGTVRIELHAPDGAGTAAPPTFRPTVLMERVSRALEEHPGLSKRAIREAVTGRNDTKDLALEVLVADGYVRTERDGQALRHHSARPYRQADDDLHRAPVPEPCPDRAPGTGESDRAPVPLPTRARGTGHDPDGTPNRAPQLVADEETT